MILSRSLSLAICGLIVCASAADLFAQRGGGGGRGAGTTARYQLATLPEVQADLKLNDEQKKLATELVAKMNAKRAALAPGGGGGGGGDFAAMMAEMAKLNAELDAQLNAKLDDALKARLHGLFAQANGAAALLDAAIGKAVGLNEEAMGKLKTINDSNRAARREAMSGFQDMSAEERAAATAKLNEKDNNALLAALNDEQKKKFTELKGAELKMDVTPLRPARGAGRGNN